MTRAALILAWFLAGAFVGRQLADPPPLVAPIHLRPPAVVYAPKYDVGSTSQAWHGLHMADSSASITVSGIRCGCYQNGTDGVWVEVQE